jgi:hypothetical protein
MIRKKFYLTLIILMFQAAYYASAETVNYEENFFKEKSLGNYFYALETLKKWTSISSDKPDIEANIYRISEIMHYTELFLPGLEALDYIMKNNSSLDLQARSKILNLKTDILLYLGRPKEALDIKNSLGYLNFKITGPFQNRGPDDFEKEIEPGTEYSEAALYKTKTGRTGWWQAKSGITGKISVENFSADVRDTIYFFHTEFETAADGIYDLLIGKTGYIDASIDGKKVFADRNRHGFARDQYFIRLRLAKGTHRLMIKLGDNGGSVTLSARIIPQQPGKDFLSADNNFRNDDGSIKTGYYSTIENIIHKKNLTRREKFLAGYYFYTQNLINTADKSELKYFQDEEIKNPFSEQSIYYMAKSSRGSHEEEKLYKSAIVINPRNIEVISELVRIKLKNNLVYEAYPLIERIDETRSGSHYYFYYLSELMRKKEWIAEAYKNSQKLLKSDYPSLGLYLDYKASFAEKKYSDAEKNLLRLYSMNCYNINIIKDLVKCHIENGKNSLAVNLLVNSISIFPDMVSLRISLAEEIALSGGSSSSIPVLSSAMAISPYNKEVLLLTGKAYLSSGMEALALHYLNRSSALDPDNYILKKMINNLYGAKNELKPYLHDEDITTLIKESENYRNEPLVILLSETSVRVNGDGSYEKRIREVYRINDEDEIKNSRAQFAVYDPDTESVDDLKCIVLNGSGRAEMTERFNKALSDPESSLYYNLQAITVPIYSLKKGSIVDWSYTVKNRGAGDYKNYFGKKFYIGGKDRVLKTNIVIAYPDSKKIYIHEKKISGHKNITEKKNELNIYKTEIYNSAPLKKEPAMPPETEILPSISFTSFKNWNEFYTWYKNLLDGRNRVNAEMKETVRNIVKNSKNKIETAQKIYYHTIERMRYVGFEFGVGGIQPRPADSTYNSRMGDCKDMSLLLSTLMNEAGIESSIAIVRTKDRGKVDQTVPIIGEFNHAICYVNLNKGFFLDPTAKVSGFRELPIDDRDITVFIVGKKGYKFLGTSSDFNLPDKIEAESEITILENGGASIKRTLSRQGTEAAQLRNSFKNKTEKIRSLNEYWNNKFPGSKVSDYKVTNEAYDVPVAYSYSVSVRDFSQVEGNEIIFSSFLIKSDYYSSFASSSVRKMPLIFSGETDLKIRTRFIIPQNFTAVTVPDDEVFSLNKFKASFRYEKGEGYIDVFSTVNISTREIQPGEYKNFRDFAKFINRKELERIIIRKK